MLTTLAVLSACCLGLGADAKAPDTAPAQKPRVLVVTGGHGFDEPEFRALFAAMTELDVTIHDLKDESEVFEDIGDWPYDVLVLYNMSQKISEKRKANFLSLLDKGVGLVVLHHAIAAFNDWPEYWKIIGARYFLKDTGVDGKTIPASTYRHDVDIPCKIEDPAHPVTAGLKDFVVRDETYKGFLVEPDNHLLVSEHHPDAQREAAWTRQYRNSKVCYIQLGHDKLSFGDDNYRTLVRQAIRWAKKS